MGDREWLLDHLVKIQKELEHLEATFGRIPFASESPANDPTGRVAWAWARWRRRVRNYLIDGNAIVDPLELDDLVLAVADLPPSNMVRRNLSTMLPYEWTRLALMGVDPVRPTSRDWALVSGLKALHFDRSLLLRLAQELTAQDSPGSMAIRQVAESATASPAGVLVVLEGAALTQFTGLGARPCIVLPRSQLTCYAGALTWLQDREVYTDVIDEVPLDEQGQSA